MDFAKSKGEIMRNISSDCRRCRKREVRAKGYCRICFEWARRSGLVDTGRKCRSREERCKLFTYGSANFCFHHLLKLANALLKARTPRSYRNNQGLTCIHCKREPAKVKGRCRDCYSEWRNKLIHKILSGFYR